MSYMWMSCNSESSFLILKYPVLCALKELLNCSVLAPVTTASVTIIKSSFIDFKGTVSLDRSCILWRECVFLSLHKGLVCFSKLSEATCSVKSCCRIFEYEFVLFLTILDC
jgi:hypothetical protein